MSGFVLIHRSLIGHPDFRNDAEAMAFAWMVMRAAWKPARVRYKGKAINLQRGQLCVSQRDMATALDRDKAWVERLWKRLREQGMVEANREAAAMLITICNYDKYQSHEQSREAVNEAQHEADARQTRGTEQIREQDKQETIPSVSNETSGKRARAKSEKTEPFPCPNGVDPVDWDSLLSNRKAQRSPMTAGAYRSIINKLEGWKRAGWPPGPIVAHAVECGWRTVFETDEMKQRQTNNGTNGRKTGTNTGRGRDGFLNACWEAADRQAGYSDAGNSGRSAGTQGLGR